MNISTRRCRWKLYEEKKSNKKTGVSAVALSLSGNMGSFESPMERLDPLPQEMHVHAELCILFQRARKLLLAAWAPHLRTPGPIINLMKSGFIQKTKLGREDFAKDS